MDQAQLKQLASDIAVKASALGLSIEQHAANEIAKLRADNSENKWSLISVGFFIGLFVGGAFGYFIL